MKIPIVLLIFNRPDTTKVVFDAIRHVRPSELFVVADGFRPGKVGEAEKCIATRKIVEKVDWDCKVFQNYSETNLGCARRVSSGLDWVFENTDSALILEDDCVPHPTFFQFCEELIDRYQQDDRIVAISGQNVQFGRSRTSYSYYFSHYNHCWGWASWRRAWKHFDFEMKLWPEVREQCLLENILVDPRAVRYWTKIFEATYRGRRDSWAYRWLFACWMQNGLTILPNVNLVSNIGFNSEATNTKSVKGKNQYAEMSTKAITFPLQHPPFVVRNYKADNFTQNTLFNPTIPMRVRAKASKIVSASLI